MSTANTYTPRKCTNANFKVKQKSLKALESLVPNMRKLRNGRWGSPAIQIRQRMQKPVTDNPRLSGPIRLKFRKSNVRSGCPEARKFPCCSTKETSSE